MGNIWICTSYGLYKCSEAFEKFDIKKSIIAAGQSLEVFSDGNKTVWLNNSNELFSFRKDSIKMFDRTKSNFKSIYSMAFSADDKIWIGDEDGLVLFDGLNWKRFDTLDIILSDRDRRIFEKYKDTNWVKENYKEYLLDEEDYFWQIGSYAANLHWDKKNTLWFKSLDALVNFDGKNWILYDTAYSAIPTTRFRDFTIDNQNNIWIGSWELGLIKFDGDYWSVYDTTNSPLLSNKIVSVHHFDDLLFVCTVKGILTFDGERWEKISTLELEVEFATCMIKDEKNNYWFGSSTGLYKYDGKKWSVFDISNSGIANNGINSIAIDCSGNFWIESLHGYLSIFNESGIQDEERTKAFLSK